MDSSLANALSARDLAVVWHPCTQMHDHETLPMLPVARAEGAWLHGHDGRRYLDAVSSWWTCLLGHRHPRIVEALKDQLDRLDHVMLAGFTHEPAIARRRALGRLTVPRYRIAGLAGTGVGPDVVDEALEILPAVTAPGRRESPDLGGAAATPAVADAVGAYLGSAADAG